jgi:hypothetical protein
MDGEDFMAVVKLPRTTRPRPLQVERFPVESPWTTPPPPGQSHRWIDGQFCAWDPEPAEVWGQIWIPVCTACRRGPLMSGQVTCGVCPPFQGDQEGRPPWL